MFKHVSLLVAAVAVVALVAGSATAEPSLKALIVDGQNNHNWAATTPVLKKILEDSGLFAVDVATTPPAPPKNATSEQKKAAVDAMAKFKPDFAKYNVVVSNYTGADWPQETQEAFVQYMKNGGGLVIYHAADNAFPKWEEFNLMIALGGWGGRNEKSGPMIRWKDGKVVEDNSPGAGGTHGPQHEFLIEVRNATHPIMTGLPAKWMHSKDELYSKLRGPAKNMTLLATAYADPAQKGTGENEPMLFTIDYGKGRIFHTALGHAVEQICDVGFIVTFQRGTEWAATGKVTQKVPAAFNSETKPLVRTELAGPKKAAGDKKPAPRSKAK